MEFNITGREGNLTTFEIISDDVEAAYALARNNTSYNCFKTDTGVVGKSNKREVGNLSILCYQVSAAKKAADEPQKSANPDEPPKKPQRKIMGVAYAELQGLNHGCSWICTDYDIEAKGACPSLEGEEICYVYPQQ